MEATLVEWQDFQQKWVMSSSALGQEHLGRKKKRTDHELNYELMSSCFCGFPNLQRLGHVQVEASQRLSKVQASDS